MHGTVFFMSAGRRKERMFMTAERKGNLIFIAFLSLFYLIYVLVLAPVYTVVCSNVLYSETYLPDIIELVRELLDLFIWAWIFSFTLFSFRYPKRSVFAYAAVPCADFLRYLLSLLVSFLFDGTPASSDMLRLYINDALIGFAFDILHFVFCLFIGHIMLSHLNSDKKKTVFSAEHQRMKKNPLGRAALLSAAMVSVLRIAMRIRYDVFYGAPEDALDLMWMILYYSSDIVYGLLVYLTSLIILRKLNKKSGFEAENFG